MQGDTSVRIGSRSPVLEVSLDYAPHSGELAPDLVMPPGEQFYLQEVLPLGGAEIAVAEPGLLCVAVPRSGLGDEGLVELLVAD